MAGCDVPGVVGVLGLFRFTDAFAALSVPDERLSSLRVDLRAVVGEDAGASAVVEVPVVVVGARALDADALSGKCIELFKLVITMTHFVSARAV